MVLELPPILPGLFNSHAIVTDPVRDDPTGRFKKRDGPPLIAMTEMTESNSESSAPYPPISPREQSAGLRLFRHADGVLVNSCAIAYAILGYSLGLWLLTQSGLWFFAGVLLLAHSLVIAAFLIHECTHQSLFNVKHADNDPHKYLGAVLSWLTGACYGTFDAMRDKHLRHHFERADIVAVHYRNILCRHRGLKKCVETGQWFCLPAVELLMHGLVMMWPFIGDKKAKSIAAQWRVIAVLVIRLALFAMLGMVFDWQLLAGYAIAYLLFLTVMGFMDAFQHQYLLLEGLQQSRRDSPTRNKARFPVDYFNRDYEESHTYSNLLSRRWPWLNLLVLNFCYHNAHHQRPVEPWYRLPALHRDSYSVASEMESVVNSQVVPFSQQIRLFFRHRVARVMAPADDRLGAGENTGAAGVSFLTPL